MDDNQIVAQLAANLAKDKEITKRYCQLTGQKFSQE